MASEITGLDDDPTSVTSSTHRSYTFTSSGGSSSGVSHGGPAADGETKKEQIVRRILVGGRIKLDIGGVTYSTSTSTLCSLEPDSGLAKMFTPPFSIVPEEDGTYFIDRNGAWFGYILDWLRDARLPPQLLAADHTIRACVTNECRYFGLTKMEGALILLAEAEAKHEAETAAVDYEAKGFEAAAAIWIAGFETAVAAEEFLQRCIIELKRHGAWKVEGWADFIRFEKRSQLGGMLDALRVQLLDRLKMRVKIHCMVPHNRYEFPEIHLRWYLNDHSDDVTMTIQAPPRPVGPTTGPLSSGSSFAPRS